jgi:hypothetical protein
MWHANLPVYDDGNLLMLTPKNDAVFSFNMNTGHLSAGRKVKVIE